MDNGYNIAFDDNEFGTTKVYLVPQCDHMSHLKKIGYIDEDDTFRCTDSELMTLEVMEAIVNHWKTYGKSEKKQMLVDLEEMS